MEKWLVQSTCTEAYQKLKAVESILETLQESGGEMVEDALENVRQAGSISIYLRKDEKRLDSSDSQQHIG